MQLRIPNSKEELISLAKDLHAQGVPVMEELLSMLQDLHKDLETAQLELVAWANRWGNLYSQHRVLTRHLDKIMNQESLNSRNSQANSERKK